MYREYPQVRSLRKRRGTQGAGLEERQTNEMSCQRGTAGTPVYIGAEGVAWLPEVEKATQTRVTLSYITQVPR